MEDFVSAYLTVLQYNSVCFSLPVATRLVMRLAIFSRINTGKGHKQIHYVQMSIYQISILNNCFRRFIWCSKGFGKFIASIWLFWKKQK